MEQLGMQVVEGVVSSAQEKLRQCVSASRSRARWTAWTHLFVINELVGNEWFLLQASSKILQTKVAPCQHRHATWQLTSFRRGMNPVYPGIWNLSLELNRPFSVSELRRRTVSGCDLDNLVGTATGSLTVLHLLLPGVVACTEGMNPEYPGIWFEGGSCLMGKPTPQNRNQEHTWRVLAAPKHTFDVVGAFLRTVLSILTYLVDEVRELRGLFLGVELIEERRGRDDLAEKGVDGVEGEEGEEVVRSAMRMGCAKRQIAKCAEGAFSLMLARSAQNGQRAEPTSKQRVLCSFRSLFET